MAGEHHYKLVYFPFRGRAEYIRYMFAVAGVPYEEETVKLEEWSSRKSSTVFEQLPYLDVDNGRHMVGQHIAIGRYLAKKFGLDGANEEEHSKADMYVDWFSELWGKLAPFIKAVFHKDDSLANKEKKEFLENCLPQFLKKYETFLNLNSTGWLVGDKPTWADIYLAEFMNRIQDTIDPTALDNFETVKKHVDQVHSIPNLAIYISTRPSRPL